MINSIFVLEFQRFIGLYGQVEMTLCLINRREPIFCRLLFVRRIGSNFGRIFFRRPAGYYGYWMQPNLEGRTRLLFPGYWMAAH
jgi:hypothetical protein